jgi:hypothetical protein
MNGIHEVRGSIPLVSTKSINKLGPTLIGPFLFGGLFQHRTANSRPIRTIGATGSL